MKKCLPAEWNYVPASNTEDAEKALTRFRRGDSLILDMAFGTERLMGIRVLRWAALKNSEILRATIIYTAFDTVDTRNALAELKMDAIPVVGKINKIQDVLLMAIGRVEQEGRA